MANKVKIKDEQGNQVFPITHVSAVLNDNGDNIGEIVSSKQNELVSGSNIKTINGQSLLGSGNITIQGGSGGEGDVNVIESITFNGNAVLVDGNKNAAISYTAPVTSVNGNTGAVTVSVPTKVSDLTNDSGFISSYTETDPVFIASAAYGITSSDIANWNGKQAAINDLADIRNGAALGATALQSFTETDPTVPSWAKASTKPTYTASEVGALPDTTVIPAAQVNSDWNANSGVAQILNKPTIPTVPTTLSSFTDDLGSNPIHTHSQYLTSVPVSSVDGQTGAVVTRVQQVVNETNVTITLNPNVFYSFGTLTSLTVTLGNTVSGRTNEYTFEFNSGSTATTLSIPATVIGIDATTIQANKHYEVSIKYDASNQNYYGLIQEW